jgi:hypothetical protein
LQGTYSLTITLSEGSSENAGDSGFNIPGFPIVAVMIGLISVALILGARARVLLNSSN